MNVINAGKSERGYHRLGLASVCLRSYAYTYLDKAHGEGSAPSESLPLIRGSLLHLGLAHHYAHQSIQKSGRALVNGVEITDANELMAPAEAVEHEAQKNGHLWMGHVPSILECLSAYARRWGTDDDWDILGIEHEYRVRLPTLPKEVSLYTQRADLVIRERSTKKVWIVDHKSAYMLNGKTAKQYVLHGQFLGYAALGRKEYGQAFGGVLLNRIKINGCEFDRKPTEPAPASVGGFVRNLVHVEKQILDYQHLPPDQWPGTLHETVCVSKYGECPFFARCQWGPA